MPRLDALYPAILEVIFQFNLVYKLSKSSSEKIRMGEPSGEVLTKILPSNVQTLAKQCTISSSFVGFIHDVASVGRKALIYKNALLLLPSVRIAVK